MMRLDATLSGKKDPRTPLWFMRQAGRYLPEYKALRQTTPDFIAYCLDSAKACEATLQPLRRYDLDAAIIFSDILMIPWALGAGVRFVEGEGPCLNPLSAPDDIARLNSQGMLERLAPVLDTLGMVRDALPPECNLIGFCGAPWTVATYMIEGGSSRDFGRIRGWLWGQTDGLRRLIDVLTEESIIWLEAKAKAGADTLMVFDTWAGAVPAEYRHEMVIAPMKRIITGLRGRGVAAPVIGFPKGIGEGLLAYASDSGVDALGLDHGVDVLWADRNLPKSLPVQGNLDPAALIIGGNPMLEAADRILDAFSSRPHIFNLGHGIGQTTPPGHVATLIEHIRKAG